MKPGQEVEVEAGDGHDGVVSVLLVGDEEVGGSVPDEGEVVEGAEDGAEVGGRCGEQRDVLEVGIVLRHVGDEMVDVVRALPPSNTQTTAEVGDESTDQSIGDEVASNTTVTGVVSSEHDLLPEHAQEAGGCEVPLGAKEVDEGAEEERVADHLLAVLDVWTVVVALVLDTLMQSTEVHGDGELCVLIYRRHAGETLGDLLLLHGRGEGHAGRVLCSESICLLLCGLVCCLIENDVSLALLIVRNVVVLTNGGAADRRLEVSPGLSYPADPVCSHALERVCGVVP